MIHRHENSKKYCYEGSCTCGQVLVAIQLPSMIDAFTPRACDCKFCTARNILSLSDPQAQIEIKSQQELEVIKHGDKLASFLICPTCKDVIGIACAFDSGSKAVLNANLLEAVSQLSSPFIVSPRLLSANDKLHRWDLSWSKVRLSTAPDTKPGQDSDGTNK